jgi:hypothetical protein
LAIGRELFFVSGILANVAVMENEGIKLITREDDEGFRVAAEYAFRLNHALMFPNQPIDEKAMKDVIERQLKEFKKEK